MCVPTCASVVPMWSSEDGLWGSVSVFPPRESWEESNPGRQAWWQSSPLSIELFHRHLPNHTVTCDPAQTRMACSSQGFVYGGKLGAPCSATSELRSVHCAPRGSTLCFGVFPFKRMASGLTELPATALASLCPDFEWQAAVIKSSSLGMLAQDWNSSAWEGEAGEFSVSLRPAWVIEWASGHPGVQRFFLKEPNQTKPKTKPTTTTKNTTQHNITQKNPLKPKKSCMVSQNRQYTAVTQWLLFDSLFPGSSSEPHRPSAWQTASNFLLRLSFSLPTSLFCSLGWSKTHGNPPASAS